MIPYDSHAIASSLRYTLCMSEDEKRKQQQRSEFILFKTVEVLLHLQTDEEVIRQRLVRAFDFRYTEAVRAMKGVVHSLAVCGRCSDGGDDWLLGMPLYTSPCSYRYEWPQAFDLRCDNHETIAVYWVTDMLLDMKVDACTIQRELVRAFELSEAQASDALSQVQRFLSASKGQSGV